ncbi:MAG TPA: S46 family peptidase [Thermoanaerobaculia bacterium]|nr:S46 family peptidase [Thermoanaerobaculia bacterium]
MKTTRALVMLGLMFLGREGYALDGKWTPEQVLQIDAKWLRAQGLEIPPAALWSETGGGLLEAAVGIEGCSSGFVSSDGLMITNHHCVFPILQQHSTPERDLITHGFLAKTKAEELSGGGVRAAIPHRETDVTAAVEGSVPAGADDLARFQAIERKGKELVAECERQANRRCRFAGFDGGVMYRLIETIEYPDVRLVYAPPRAVGEYGGEIDNWSWPRHTGDFALLRVWAAADGSPAPKGEGTQSYKPRHWYPIASQGVKPGDFVMLAGYPGTTYRSLIAAEMHERAELFFPRRAELYRVWIDIMEAASKQGDAPRLALSDRMKSLANREKSSRGQVEGLARGKVLAKKEAEEGEILAWIAAHPGNPATAAATAAHAELATRIAERIKTWDRDFLLSQARGGSKPLELALLLVRWAGERAKPDLEREPDYMARNSDRLAEKLKLDQTKMHGPTEEILLAHWLGRFAALPAGNRSAAVEAVLQGEDGPAAIRAKAAALLSGSKVADAAERAKMTGETEEQLRARHDPLLDFAFALDRELRELKERDDRHEGAISRLRPAWRKGVAAWAGKPIAPDGNGTLRVSFAHVQGYRPRDGVWMEPQTTLAGMVQKNTGEEPFAAPERVLAAAPQAPASRFADPKLHDVPVAFLADADTTGGNSGSPVLNGKGELVGVNFDRVWENVANDFGFNPEVARNVAVDVRYLLWMLDGIEGEAAQPLLDELLGAGGGAKTAKP